MDMAIGKLFFAIILCFVLYICFKGLFWVSADHQLTYLFTGWLYELEQIYMQLTLVNWPLFVWSVETLKSGQMTI